MDSRPKLTRGLRDLLAIDRTRMANRRTLLAFIVTGLHMVAMGLTFANVKEFEGLGWLSLPLYAIALTTIVIGIVSYLRIRRVVENAYGIVDEVK